jgi:tetratricopeptide (TPR) repeat protein
MSQPHSRFPLVPFDPYGEGSPLHPLETGEALQLASAESCLQRGNRHYLAYLSRHCRKALTQAVEQYRQALELNPALAEAYLKLGVALWEQGGLSVDAALDYCDMALRLEPDYGEAYLRKGMLLRQAGRLEEAVTSLRLAGGKPQEHPAQVRLALGGLLWRQALGIDSTLSPGGRIQAALGGLLEWVSGCCLLPGDRTACRVLWTTLGSDASVLGLTLLGRLLKSLGLRAPVVSLYEWASQWMPHEAIFSHRLGDLRREQGDLDGAIRCYQQAHEQEPGNALLHKKLGVAYHHRNEPTSAIQNLEKAVESDDADFETRYSLAQLYAQQGDYMRALYHYKDLLREAPQNPYLHSNMAYVLFRLEDYEGAIRAYRAAVEAGEDPLWTSTVAQTLGTLYYQVRHDAESAERMLQMAYRLDSGNLECLTLLGDIYTEQGRYEDATHLYRHLLDAEPDNADCHNYMGYLLWQLDRNEEAIGFYRRAIELDADNPIAYNNLGVIFLDEKCAPDTALSLFEQAVTLKSDYTLARFNVARSLEALGKTARAAKSYADTLEWNRRNPELNETEIQERLARLFEV